MKRFYLEYESDEIVCGSNLHTYGYANTVKTAKGYISKCRKTQEKYNPRNFRVFDTETDDEYARCVYAE